ncbi:MAG: EF-hand domain-containing protein [Tsuneonella sp.]
MCKLTLSIALATLATAGVAIAAPGMTQDKNWGGDVTRAQAEAQAAQRFARMDANGDGKLDSADRAAMRAKMFDRIDANHDGSISRDEFAAMHRGGRDGQPDAGAPDGDHAMNRGMGGGHHMGMRGHRGGMGMMKAADTNADGAISQAEFTAGALKRFDAADANHDGTVTQAERKAARDAMRAQWKANREARQQG